MGKTYFTSEECAVLLKEELVKHNKPFEKLSYDLAPEPWIGFLDFNYNTGALRDGVGIYEKLKAKDIHGACQKILEYRYIRVNGKLLDCSIKANKCSGIWTRRYALVSKLYETLHENATLKANNQTLLEANQTNQNTIDKLNALETKLDDLNIALKQMAEEQDQSTEVAVEAIQPLKSKGEEYEMLNTKYPDDPAINCVFTPNSAGCNPDGSRKGETTEVSN